MQGRYRQCHDKVLTTLTDILEQEHYWAPSPLWKSIRYRFSRAKPSRICCNERMGNEAWSQGCGPSLSCGLLRETKSSWQNIPMGEGLRGIGRKKENQAPTTCPGLSGQRLDITAVFAMEVGCQGLPAQLMWNLMTKVRVRGHKRKRAADPPLESVVVKETL